MGRRLGQHFLFDTTILGRIADAASIAPDDTIAEVGPGPGSLTKELLDRINSGGAGRVVAIELDGQLYEKLKEKFADEPKLELVHGDALRFPFESLGVFKVVANIPYQITTPLIFRLLKEKGLVSMTLTIQREVADRIAASPGTKDYGALTLAIQYHGEPKKILDIPRWAFRPAPKVDSACVHINILPRPRVDTADPAFLFGLIKTAFSKRRKTITNGIKGLCPEPLKALEAAGIAPMRRPETLTLEEFARLADSVKP
ncbi:MAG: 16S rRNA (adenine(1518)-N(6)/adenine(1519)-N(6))-dimethyltransferase RsmA [Nitrospiraceae bacterium]|nr:16S rRNA (adenine(1518)-N(6)/adenine(1519)-N(6))-dimethyltransferase RsmA [Nitrospiraceae bacterium]